MSEIYGDERDMDVLNEPEMEELEDWALDGNCEATDGCIVEPDGVCPHRHKSWLLVLKYV